MTQTVNTASAPYAGASDVTNRFDSFLIAQLCMDSGVVPAVSALAGNAKLETALTSASGQVEAALTAGGRYDPTDLQALTGASLEFLKTLVCVLCVQCLWFSRPDREGKPYPAFEWAEKQLEALRKGENVLGFANTQQAGVTSLTIDTPQQVARRSTPVTRASRYFGRRNNEFPQHP